VSVVFWGSACRQLFARVFVGDVIFLSHFTVNLYTRRSDSLSSESTTPKGEIEFKFNTNNPRGELVVLEEAHGMSMTERATRSHSELNRPLVIRLTEAQAQAEHPPEAGEETLEHRVALLPQLELRSAKLASLYLLADDTEFDLLGIVTFVGRIERQRNAVSNKFYRCRWIRVYHSGIELDVQLYSNSQPAAFESFEPLQIVLLTALRYCTVATSTSGCASTPTPDPPPHHTYRLASYIKDTSTARHQFARSSFYTQMLIGDELPQLPEVHSLT